MSSNRRRRGVSENSNIPIHMRNVRHRNNLSILGERNCDEEDDISNFLSINPNRNNLENISPNIMGVPQLQSTVQTSTPDNVLTRENAFDIRQGLFVSSDRPPKTFLGSSTTHVGSSSNSQRKQFNIGSPRRLSFDLNESPQEPIIDLTADAFDVETFLRTSRSCATNVNHPVNNHAIDFDLNDPMDANDGSVNFHTHAKDFDLNEPAEVEAEMIDIDNNAMEFDLNDPATDDDELIDVDDYPPTVAETSLNNQRTIHLRKFHEAWNFGGPTAECPNCGAVMWYEERSDKRYKNSWNVKFSLCCMNGKIQLPRMTEPPALLKQLHDPNDPRSREFRSNIRTYNAILAFTSNGGTVDRTVNNGGGIYAFKINAMNYHRIGTLIPDEGERPRFCQLYIIDTANEVSNRIRTFGEDGQNENLNPEIVANLIQMVDSHNPLAQSFRKARDRFESVGYSPVTLKLIGTRSKDGRQYNLPTASEVAALIVDGGEESQGERDILIESHNGRVNRISELHPSYMALQYPLLFPWGEDGYQTEILHRDAEGSSRKRTKVTQREYYAYRIQFRRNESPLIINSGRLSLAYFCDCYTTILAERIYWVLRNQIKFRSDIVKGLVDAVVRGDTAPSSTGKRIILPSSVTGSPRYMVQAYQDSMAIVRWAGPPDLFITFTCNPKWKEIDEFLKLIPGQKAEDRPDIVVRVFKIKLDELVRDLKRGEHFGKVKAVIYTVEFQKRGLPHAHIALFLDAAHKIKDVNSVDRLISAELPDPVTDPVGFKAVSQFMFHGPCGNARKTSPCMRNGKCSKHYPKRWNSQTTISQDGYPTYRRTKDNRSAKVKGVYLDNRWVVPHNVDLVVKYDAHINVELCNQSRCIKYLFKYMCKGEDRATVTIQENATVNSGSDQVTEVPVNEVTRYLTVHYVGGSEAMWRIFKFDIQLREPSVERLNFHLEDEQSVVFSEHDHITEVLNRDSTYRTIFTEWFRANQLYESARDLTFVEFPSKFVWHSQEKEWRPRKKGFSVGRLYFAHPSSGERYYLRILLNVVKGPLCYADIRTVDGTTYLTYKEACRALGLLQDDLDWHQTLQEASQWASGHEMRNLFVTLLLFCEVVDQYDFWYKNWQLLSDDILYIKRRDFQRPDLVLSDAQLQNYALFEIERIMNRNGRSLRDFGTIPFPEMGEGSLERNALIREELIYDKDALALEHADLFNQLNIEQRQVYDDVVMSALNGTGGFYFVYGSGGTGKTFLWKTILSKVRSEGKIAIAVASSGIAALLMTGGRTAHSRFKIPIQIDNTSSCDVKQGSPVAELLLHTSLIIWDEAPMAHRHAFEAVDRMLRDIMRAKDPENENKVFGGITTVLGGDFRQILPVVPRGSRGDIVHAAVSKSDIWQHCQLFTLSINMRLRNSTPSSIVDFSKWLLDLGDGKLPPVVSDGTQDDSLIRIEDKFLIPNGNDSVRDIVDHTYPDLLGNFDNPSFLRDRAILSPTNEIVDTVNNYIISRIPGESKIYRSADRISPSSGNVEEQSLLYPQEFLNSLKFTGVPNHEIELKVGVPIILLRNINQSMGLCNGTRLIVVRLGSRVIEAETITGSNVGQHVFIPRVEICPSDGRWPFNFTRRQFPIKVCYAMTINKSQGQTLQNVGIYLPKSVFTHGQLYVAASRVSSPEGLKILIEEEENSIVGCTNNIVYNEVFDHVFRR